jgi:hypothetical protein
MGSKLHTLPNSYVQYHSSANRNLGITVQKIAQHNKTVSLQNKQCAMTKFLTAVSIPLTDIYRLIKVQTCKFGTYLNEKQQSRRPERLADEVQ